MTRPAPKPARPSRHTAPLDERPRLRFRAVYEPDEAATARALLFVLRAGEERKRETPAVANEEAD